MINDSLHVYYLTQMGIDCWVRRTESKDKQLQSLMREVSSCMACGFDTADFSRENLDARCMIVAEMPIHHKTYDVLLDNMLASIALRPDMIYTTHLLKCRTHLQAQINIIQPLFILALGTVAGQCLLDCTSEVVDLRQQIHDDDKIPVIVTYHPDLLLQKPLLKKQAWEDLQKIRCLMDMSCKILS